MQDLSALSTLTLCTVLAWTAAENSRNCTSSGTGARSLNNPLKLPSREEGEPWSLRPSAP